VSLLQGGGNVAVSAEGHPAPPTFSPIAKDLLDAIHAHGEGTLSPAEAVYTNRDLDLL